MAEVRFLSRADTHGLASPSAFVTAVKSAYRQRGNGAEAKPRQRFRRSNPPGMLTSYGAILPESGVMGGYTYSAGFGGEDAWFVTPLFDADSGQPIAILDGVAMNPFKTGAVGAVAVDALAREDATSVGIIGSGPQARGQLRATATVRPLETVSVFSPTPENRRSFAWEFNDRLEADVTAVDSPAAAIRNADIVITATTAEKPVIDDTAISDGTHITAMGQYHPERREIDVETIERSTYVPDLTDRVMIDAGAFLAAHRRGLIDESHVHAELGDVVAGTADGRRHRTDVTVFDSGGTAIETVAGAALLYERAVEAGRGTVIEFEPASEALTGR